jgi:hypothetical protein
MGQSGMKYYARLQLTEYDSEIDRFFHEANQLTISKRFSKQAANCLIEVMDNAFRYSNQSSEVMIEIELSKTSISFIVVNQSKLSDIEELMFQVELYRRLSEVELDNLYRQKLNNNVFNERGGAGLGILQIMRKKCFKDINIKPKLGEGSQVFCRVELMLAEEIV